MHPLRLIHFHLVPTSHPDWPVLFLIAKSKGNKAHMKTLESSFVRAVALAFFATYEPMSAWLCRKSKNLVKNLKTSILHNRPIDCKFMVKMPELSNGYPSDHLDVLGSLTASFFLKLGVFYTDPNRHTLMALASFAYDQFAREIDETIKRLQLPTAIPNFMDFEKRRYDQIANETFAESSDSFLPKLESTLAGTENAVQSLLQYYRPS